MKIKNIINKLDLLPNKKEYIVLKGKAEVIVNSLKESIKKLRINADVFIGGSFAKNTLVKKDIHDIDLFVRFDWEYEALTEELEKIVRLCAKKLKVKYQKLHGSRDYFRIEIDKIFFEIIPVTRIKKPKEARNVTDLSYFHVNYVKKNINDKIAKEIAAAKTFCNALGVYGAESYIQGFSGYAVECLLVYYKSFEKMLRALCKVNERIILDPERQYKNEQETLLSLNENKLHSPIVLIDPTWKERNVLAALNNESFNKFKNEAKKFLKKPALSYFDLQDLDAGALKKTAKEQNFEFLDIELETSKQPGDIAGTKMKKFTNFLTLEIEKSFEVKKKEFDYHDEQRAKLYLILKSKNEIIKIGPPIKMEKACKAFKKANKETYEKNGYLHSKIIINYSAKRFLSLWMKKYAKKVKEMDITRIKVI